MKLEKITTKETGTRRVYDDACAAAHALDLLGERWALLVVRELMLGPRRFGDIRAGLPGLSANVLTQRLESLEGAGIVQRRRLPPPASVQVYELTPWGYEAEPIFQALGRWAARSPMHDPARPFSTASLILSLRTMFDPARAQGLAGRIGLDTGEGFVAEIGAGRLQIERGDLRICGAVIAGTAQIIAAAIYGGQKPDILEAAGALSVTGDRDLLARFLDLFPLPPKVRPPA